MSEYLDGVDPQHNISQKIYEKYNFADPENPGFAKIEHFEPVFAFDYISLNKGNLCFNNPDLKANHYHDFFNRLYEISASPYSEVKYNDDHFHTINLRRNKHKDIREILLEDAKHYTGDQTIDADSLPEIWQFTIATDSENNYAPRAVGFFGTHGIFYFLWFDVDHSIFEQK